MRSFGFFVTVALMVTSLLMSSQSLSESASWKLDSDQSSIHFSSTKIISSLKSIILVILMLHILERMCSQGVFN